MRFDVDWVNKRRSIPVRDLTCFLARAFPIVAGSMVEVMMPREKDERSKSEMGLRLYRVGEECINEIRDLGSKRAPSP